jgi:hypothetical protein
MLCITHCGYNIQRVMNVNARLLVLICLQGLSAVGDAVCQQGRNDVFDIWLCAQAYMGHTTYVESCW